VARTAKRRRRSSPRTLIGLAVGGALLVVGLMVGISLATRPGGGAPRADLPVEGRSMGSAGAPVRLEEWVDFQCPACRAYALGSGRLLEESYVKDGKVQVTVRHFAFLGQESVWAAEASECAREQGRFWDYYYKLFQEQRGTNSGAFSKENLKRFARDLGLDPQAFDACLDSDRYRDAVLAERSQGERIGINATPTLVLTGPGGTSSLIRGAPTFEQLTRTIDALLALAGPRGQQSAQ